MRYKNIFLIVVSLLVLIGVSQSGKAMAPGFSFHIGVVKEADNDTLHSHNGTTVGGVLGHYYLNNGTYFFNLTLENSNSTHNVTGINITLGNGLYWGGGNWTNISLEFKNVSTSNLTKIRWNNVAGAGGEDTVMNASSGLWVGFNATINMSKDVDGIYNMTLYVEYKEDAATTVVATANLTSNLTIDNTPPVLSSSVSNSTTKINVTFTETNGLQEWNVIAGCFNVSYVNSSVGNLTNLDVSAVEGRWDTTNKTFTLTTAAFRKNETPRVTINCTKIADWAGNNVTNGTYVITGDKIRPAMLTRGINYNDTTRNLTLIFDEPMGSKISALGIALADNITRQNTFQLTEGNISAYKVYPGPGNKTVIQLTEWARDKIRGWRPTASGLNISIERVAMNDTYNNTLINLTLRNQSTNTYQRDNTNPVLVAALYNHSSMTLTLNFSETMHVSSFNSTRDLWIGNQANLSNISQCRLIRINTTKVDNSTNATSFTMNLTEAMAANLSEWKVTTLYILLSNKTITDLAGNNISTTLTTNHTAKGYINGSGYTNDTTAPVLKAIITLTDPSPTKAGKVEFNISFNEYMDRETTFISVTFHPNMTSNTYVLAQGNWSNYTFYNGTFTINNSWYNDVGDGKTTINVSGAKDIGGTAMSAGNTTNFFIIDTTQPTLSMVWYNDTSYNYNESTGEQNGSDFLVLKFSENVTFDYIADNSTGNASGAIYIANGSGLSGPFYGNASHKQGGIYMRLSDYKKVRVAIAKNMSIWSRGAYNGTGRVQGIIVANGTDGITDEAGNRLSNSTGVKDIYDHGFTWLADAAGTVTWKGISVPHDVNSTATWRTLNGSDIGGSYTGVVYTYNGTGWVTVTPTSNDFIPLRGYLLKITGIAPNNTVDVAIQTDLRGSPNAETWSSYTTSIKVDDGAYSLIGVNGYLDDGAVADQTATGELLNSIGGANNNMVNSIVYADETGTGIGEPAAILSNQLVPYRAYWIWTNTITGSSTHYDFNGYSDQNLI